MDGVGLYGLAMAVVATTGAVLTTRENRLAKRDALDHDEQKITLTNRVAALVSQEASCRETCARQQLEIDELRKQMQEMRARLDAYLQPPIPHGIP